tara:strand:+ start:1720 stop:1953 length:234 start_codon:yes stop_codon:yes gene_type:complete
MAFKLTMKKLIIFFLFPILGFSQITFNDLMSIRDKKMFKKVMIENGWRIQNPNYEKSGEKVHYKLFSRIGTTLISGE